MPANTTQHAPNTKTKTHRCRSVVARAAAVALTRNSGCSAHAEPIHSQDVKWTRLEISGTCCVGCVCVLQDLCACACAVDPATPPKPHDRQASLNALEAHSIVSRSMARARRQVHSRRARAMFFCVFALALSPKNAQIALVLPGSINKSTYTSSIACMRAAEAPRQLDLLNAQTPAAHKAAPSPAQRPQLLIPLRSTGTKCSNRRPTEHTTLHRERSGGPPDDGQLERKRGAHHTSCCKRSWRAAASAGCRTCSSTSCRSGWLFPQAPATRRRARPRLRCSSRAS